MKSMQLSFAETADGFRRINLAGKLDDVGVRQIETSFADHCAGEQVRVLVDLSGVDFMASIGIRLLVLNSRAVAADGQAGALDPNPLVRNIFDVADISALIPIYSDLKSAEAALKGLQPHLNPSAARRHQGQPHPRPVSYSLTATTETARQRGHARFRVVTIVTPH